MRIRVKAEIEQLKNINQALDTLLQEQPCTEEVRTQIYLCVEELFVNIASYAYEDTVGMAEIEMHIEKGVLSVTFYDWGVPYNPLEKEPPDLLADAEDRQMGGLGIYMVRCMMDQVEYERKENQNCLCIRKKLNESL